MTSSTLTRPLPPALVALLDDLVLAGWSAESPQALDPDAEQLARREQADYTD